jgi:murein L,D-transpeptidase YafK
MRTLLCSVLLGIICITNTSFTKKFSVNFATAGKNSFLVVVTKSKYELQLYDSSGDLMLTYPVVFGNKDLGDKMMQGDRKTPEGTFHIINKRKHEKWHCFLALDYPNSDSYEKFNRRKEEGLIPADAKIGGDIGIHGTWPNEDFAIDQYQNWTEGCISTKNKYVQELFEILPLGTRVEIRH